MSETTRVQPAAPPAMTNGDEWLQGIPPEVHIATDGEVYCSVKPTQLHAIRKRAGRVLWKAMEVSYEHFPIDRTDLRVKTAYRMLTEKTICNALTAPVSVTAKDHNEIREEYKNDKLAPDDAREFGVVARKLPLKMDCPANYDWAGSELYNDVERCEDVTDSIRGDGIPTVMFAIDLSAQKALRILKDISEAHYYTSFGDDGFTRCVGGKNYTDIHQTLFTSPLWFDVEFILRATHSTSANEYDAWTAWTMRRSCTTPGGKQLRAESFLFDFGLRVFVPVDVELNGERIKRTLVIKQVAAASDSMGASLITKLDIPYERVIANAYVKKLYLQAKHRGWALRNAE